MLVIANRDSVCAGDDSESHEYTLDVKPRMSVLDVIARLRSGLPGAVDSTSTWVAERRFSRYAGTGDPSQLIAVISGRWSQPWLFVDEATTVEDMASDQDTAVIHFRYYEEADPALAFTKLRQLAGPPNEPQSFDHWTIVRHFR